MAIWPANGDTDWNSKNRAFITVGHDLATGEHTVINGDSPTGDDSESNTMLKAHAYLTQTSGFVTAFTVSDSTNLLVGYVGDTNDPAGAGTKVIQSRVGTTSGTEIPSVTFFVPNGKYFEITLSTDTPTIIWTPLVPSGGNPIDQD